MTVEVYSFGYLLKFIKYYANTNHALGARRISEIARRR